MSKRNKRGKSYTSRLFSMPVSRICTDAFRETRDGGERSTILGSTCHGKCLVEQFQFHRLTFFTAIYDVRVLFCNRLRMEVEVCGKCGRGVDGVWTGCGRAEICGHVWTRKLLKTERKVYVFKFILIRVDGASTAQCGRCMLNFQACS